MGNLRMNADQISYKGGEKPMSVEEAIKNAGNTGLAHTADIAPDFSTESAYSAGDYVYHNGTMYVFTVDHAAGAWSTSDTQEVTVGGEISTLAGEASDLYAQKANQITIAPFFSAEASYDPGDLVYYNGLSYRCVNAHEGEWDADDFAATTIANELSSLMSGLNGVAATVNEMTNQGSQSDFEGYYVKVGRLCIFSLVVTKSQAEYTIGLIPNICPIMQTVVAYDSANAKDVYVTKVGINTFVQIASAQLSNQTRVSGVFITES